jgi:hypothetical protein
MVERHATMTKSPIRLAAPALLLMHLWYAVP